MVPSLPTLSCRPLGREWCLISRNSCRRKGTAADRFAYSVRKEEAYLAPELASRIDAWEAGRFFEPIETMSLKVLFFGTGLDAVAAETRSQIMKGVREIGVDAGGPADMLLTSEQVREEPDFPSASGRAVSDVAELERIDLAVCIAITGDDCPGIPAELYLLENRVDLLAKVRLLRPRDGASDMRVTQLEAVLPASQCFHYTLDQFEGYQTITWICRRWIDQARRERFAHLHG